MAELSLQQQQAIAIAKARARAKLKERQNGALEQDIASNAAPVDNRTFMEKYSSKRPTLADAPDTVIGVGKGVVNAATEVVKGKTNEGEFINDRINEIENPILKAGAKGLHMAVNPLGNALDAGMSWLSGEEGPGNATAQVNETLPRMEPTEGTVQEVFTPGAEMAAGVLAGNKAAGAVKAGGMMGVGGRLLGSELGMAATMDKDTETVLTGDNGSIASIPGAGDLVEGEDPASVEFKKSLNIAQDALVTGAAAGAFGTAAGNTLKYVGSVLGAIPKWRNLDQIQQNFVETILEHASNVPPNATKEQRDVVYREIIDYVNQNSDVAIKLGDDALKDSKLTQDTITSLVNRLDRGDPQQDVLVRQLESMRASAKEGGSARLEATMAGPKNAQDEVLTNLQTTRGGDAAIDQTKEVLQKGGRQQVEEARIPLGKAQDDLSIVEGDTQKMIREDPTFGDEIKRAEAGGPRLDANQKSLDLQEQTVDNLKNIRGADKKVRDEAYKAIADLEVPANMKSFEATYEKVKASLPKDIQDDVDRLIAGSDGSFGYLNNVVRPRLSSRITDMFNQSEGTIAKDLISVRDNITKDQVDRLIKGKQKGGSQVVRAAENANKENLNYVDRWNQGAGEDLRMNEKINKNKSINFKEEGRNILLSTIKDPNRRESITKLSEILGEDKQGVLGDIAVLESLKDVTSSLGKGKKLSNEDMLKVVKPLRDMSANFSGAQKDRIENFLSTVESKNWDADQLKSTIKELEAGVKTKESEVYDGYLGDFFKRNSTGEYEDLHSGSAIFDKLLKDKQIGGEGGKLSKILADAEKDPKALKGLEAAWGKTAKGIVDSSKDTAELPKEFLETGRAIFKDNPHIIEGIEELNRRARDMDRASKARLGSAVDIRDNQTKAHGAVNQLITFAFGVLNPTAARLRGISNDVLKKSDSKDIAKDALDIILADPKEFSRIATEISDKKLKSLTPNQKKLIYNWVTKSAMYGDGDGKDDSLDDQTKQAFN